jgi:predicted nucleic-acid-binding Zn-ribbon protein
MTSMPGSTRACAKCGGEMEEGFVLDYTYGGRLQSGWVEGEPERSLWRGIKLRGKEQLPVFTFRCSRCGYLESYAPSA